jgi:hypothetical protein
MPDGYISADTRQLLADHLGPYGERVMHEHKKYKDATAAQLPVLSPELPPADIDKEVQKAVGPGLENGAQVLLGLAMLPQGDGERIGELSKLLERVNEEAVGTSDFVNPQHGPRHA